MNVFEQKPLNKAHMFERKAKKCLENNEVKNGIRFYQDASVHMSKAMEAKYSLNCYSILRSQYDKYNKLILRYQKQLEQEEISIAVPVETFEEETKKSVQLISGTIEPKQKILMNEVHNFSIEQREPDSLLQFLPIPKAVSVRKLKKLPKGDRDIIEELNTQNLNLRRHFESVLENKEKLEQENLHLHAKVYTLELEVKELQNLLNEKSNECASLQHDIIPQSFLFDNSHKVSRHNKNS